MIVTIDTNILVGAFTHDEPDHRCLTTYCSSEKDTGVSLDQDGVIVGQYQRNVGERNGYQKWYKRLRDRQAIHYYDSRVPGDHKCRLLQLGCHQQSDHVFIGVAFNSGRILISEDSDLGKGPKGKSAPYCHVLDYLTAEMELRVYDAPEACDSLWHLSAKVP